MITGQKSMARYLPDVIEQAHDEMIAAGAPYDWDSVAEEVALSLPQWFMDAAIERDNQDERWGSVEDNPHTGPEWLSILAKQIGQLAEQVNANHWESYRAPGSEHWQNAHMPGIIRRSKIRRELVQIVAVCGAMYDQLGTTQGFKPNNDE